MSTLLVSLTTENPGPWLAAATLNPFLILSLVGLSLQLGIAIFFLTRLQAPVDRAPSLIRWGSERRVTS